MSLCIYETQENKEQSDSKTCIWLSGRPLHLVQPYVSSVIDPWHEEREWNRFLQSGIAVILSMRQSSVWVTCCKNTWLCTTGSGHIFFSTAYIACQFEGGNHLEDHLRHCLDRGENLRVNWMWWIRVYRLLGAFLLSLGVIILFFCARVFSPSKANRFDRMANMFRPGSYLLLALIFRGPSLATIPAYSKQDRGDESPERVLEMKWLEPGPNTLIEAPAKVSEKPSSPVVNSDFGPMW